jgi:signal transduction histidine kinase
VSLPEWRRSPRVAAWLSAGIVGSLLVLAWFGFRASREWQRSAELLAERHAEEAADLLVTALIRDMRATHSMILSSRVWEGYAYDSPYDVTTLVASAFARYPYPEAFFAWTAGTRASEMTFFTRSERPPQWLPPIVQRARYPVTLVHNDPLAKRIQREVAEAVSQNRDLWVVELSMDGAPYQVVITLHYRNRFEQELESISGYLVNLAWARRHYFPDITRQVARISGNDRGLTFGILDANNEPVVAPVAGSVAIARRYLPLTFFDAVAAAINPPGDLAPERWSIVVSGATDPALAAATRASSRTVAFVALAAAVLVVGLVLTNRAIRASAELATIRADFAASITHELKTPIASIRAVGDTLSAGRFRSAQQQREYAALVVQEAKRLSRLVDNLLAHARVTDVADVYSFEAVAVRPLIERAITTFAQQLQQAQFDVRIEVPEGLAPIRADQSAMELVLDNLIDNAIRYSTDVKQITISATSCGRNISISVADFGCGIAERDLTRVTQKFVRGQNARAPGTGLGLSIVQRIVQDHGGVLTIRSVVNHGTVVTIEAPVGVTA